jgi:hypothetical protein
LKQNHCIFNIECGKIEIRYKKEMKLGMEIIRGSEYQDFLRCRKRWNWRWNEGLRSKKLNDKLFTGSLIHKWLEVYYETGDIVDSLAAMQKMYLEADTQYSDQVQLQELWELVCDITHHYLETWEETDKEYITLATELEFMVRLDEEIAFTGTIDWVFQDKDGHIWFADHKTTTSIEKYEKNSLMDRQISRYWWALNMICQGVGRVRNKETGQYEKFEPLLDKEIFGFQYNVILKDVPRKPELLKKGGLSKNKSQKTTYELYCQAIDENNLLTSDYKDILDHLEQLGNRYFKRVDVIRTPQEIEAAIWEFLYTAEDMAGLKSGLEIAKNPADFQIMQMAGKNPQYKLYRNITSDCSWDCEFKALCQAEIEGSNTSFLKNSSYEKGE